jgi:hypothetical protein
VTTLNYRTISTLYKSLEHINYFSQPVTVSTSSFLVTALTVEILQLPRSRHCRLATNLTTELTQVKVKVTLRLTVGQSVSKSWCRAPSLGVEPHLGLMTRYLVLFDSYGLVFFCGAPSLTRGRVSLLSESLPALVSHLL